jgi:hemolysin D
MHPAANNESGIWALQLLLRLRGHAATLEDLRRHCDHDAAGADEILHCARATGLAARLEATAWDKLAALPLPAIAILRDGRFILLGAVNDEKAVILTADAERPMVVMRSEFEALWNGQLIWLRQPGAGALDKLMQRFDANLVPRARNALTPATQRAVHVTREAAAGLVTRFRDLRHAVTAPPPDGKRRPTDERAFLPAALEIVETPPSPLGRAIAFSIMAVFGIALLWSCIGSVDIVAIAPGKVIPSGRTKTIQPLESGVVRAIHVHDGQSVKSGDVLIELDTTAINAELEHLRGNLMATRLEIARLEASIANKDDPLLAFTPPQDAPADLIEIHRGLLISQTSEQKAKLATIESQLAQKVAERDTIQASVDKLKATITPLQQRVEIREQLFQKELGSKLTYLTELQDLVSQRHDILVQTRRNSETNAAITGLMETRTKVMAEYERNLFDALTKAKKTAAGLGQDIIKTDRRRNLQMLTAPVDGIVQQLAIHTIGGIVTPAQALMLVVPAGSRLEIEAMVSNRDIGFVAAGQQAAIKVDTFNFTRYGLLNGTILAVSQDAITRDKPNVKASETAPGSENASSEPRGQELLYSARISVDRTQLQIDDKQVNLSPGMAVTAEIKTGSRRIISYLMSPLARYQHDSLRER